MIGCFESDANSFVILSVHWGKSFGLSFDVTRNEFERVLTNTD